MFRCPLCLKNVDGPADLRGFCLDHKIAIDWPADGSMIRCPSRGCGSHGLFGGDFGLLVSHRSCPCGSPFGTVEPSGWITVRQAASGSRAATDRQHNASHWQVKALRTVFEASLDGMWFPAQLLVPPGRSANHRLVALLGAKKAGKSYLAMHALDDQGYDSGEWRPAGDFIYIYPADGTSASQEFLRTLVLREVMARNEAFVLPATPVRAQNLKVAYLLRSNPLPQVSGPGVVRWLQSVARALGRTWRQVSAAPRVLYLYDLAGEMAARMHDPVIERHNQAVDVVAVVVAADRLFGGNEAEAVADTNLRLQNLALLRSVRPNVRTAIVITHVDQLAAPPWGNSIPQGDAAKSAIATAIRSQFPSDAARREFLRHLQETDAVFLTRPDDPQVQTPVVIGLDAFVRWCFEG